MRGRDTLILSCAFVGVAVIVGVGLVDDSYIFLRYARHIATGEGPVFNPGETVEGYSSPLWLATLVPLFGIKSDPSSLAMGLSAFCGLLSVLVLASNRTFWHGLLLATNPAFVFWSFSGMESALVALLLLLTFVALFPRRGPPRTWAAGVCFGLALLVRPDVACFAPLALARVVLGSEPGIRSGLRSGMLFCLLVLGLVIPHAIWRHTVYDSWLPNTYFAKLGVALSSRLSSGAVYAAAAGVNLLPLAALYAFTTTEYRRAAIVIAVFWAGWIIFAGGDFFPYYRFVVPILPIVIFAVGAGPSPPLARAIAGRWRLARAGAALMLVANVNLFFSRERTAAASELEMASGWAAIGRELDNLLGPDATVAVLAAGALPYYANRRTIDLLGLTDRHIGRDGHINPDAAIGHQRYDSDYVLSWRPTVIVLPESGKLVDEPPPPEWPHYTYPQIRYGYALADLVARAETHERYEVRTEKLPEGRLLAALWRKP